MSDFSAEVVLFIAVAAIAVIAWFGGIAEFFMVQRLRPRVFRTGPLVLRERWSTPHDPERVDLGRTYYTAIGKFRFVASDELVFVRQWFGPQSGGPPLKGRVTWCTGNEGGSLEVRSPLAPIVFVASVLAGVTSASIADMIAASTASQAMSAAVLPAVLWIGSALIYRLSLQLEVPWTRRVIQELEGALSRPA